MKKYGIYIYVTVAVLIVFFLVWGRQYKMAYVKMGDVVEHYNMKVELENLFSVEIEKRKDKLDVLRSALDSIMSVDTTLAEKYEAHYLDEIKQFSEYQNKKSSEIKMQVLKRINEGALNFGKDRDYDFLFGANGQGSIMYASEAEDVTKEFLEYLNNDFEG